LNEPFDIEIKYSVLDFRFAFGSIFMILSDRNDTLLSFTGIISCTALLVVSVMVMLPTPFTIGSLNVTDKDAVV
tara:strand:- start:2419 stop:2640 length:222 start_codon:yes stop_codon:yes gene_type:complete